jgi:hypothetical protein
MEIMSSETITRNDLKAVLESVLPTPSPVDFFYPIGSYYETSDANFNPNTAWGGTWVLESGGRVHISSGANEANTTNFWGSYPAGTNIFPLGEMGGEPRHTLTINEMPSHQHQLTLDAYGTDTASGVKWTSGNNMGKFKYAGDMIEPTGGGQAHNNIQPYVVVNRWHRTA